MQYADFVASDGLVDAYPLRAMAGAFFRGLVTVILPQSAIVEPAASRGSSNVAGSSLGLNHSRTQHLTVPRNLERAMADWIHLLFQTAALVSGLGLVVSPRETRKEALRFIQTLASDATA